MQVNINSKIVRKLEKLSQKTEKSVDEVLDLLLSRYGHTLTSDEETLSEDVTWTDEEIEALLTMKEPLNSKEIVEQGLLGTWTDENISDGQEWLEQQRANRRKKFQW